MKNKIYLIGLIFSFILSCEKDDKINELSCRYTAFMYIPSGIHHLGQMSGDYILIGSDSINSDNLIQDFIKSKYYLDKRYVFKIHSTYNYPYKYAALKLNITHSCAKITWILDDLEKSSIISFAHYTTQTNDCKNLIWETIGKLCVNSYSNVFYLKVKDTNDLSDLNKILSVTNTWIRAQDQFMSDWYTIFADKNSKGDAIEMANYFHETGLFAVSQPDIIKIVVK